MNILCLDLDDCILPSPVTSFGLLEDDIDIFEINLKRIVIMLKKYEMKVFLTSSWSSLFDYNNGKITIKKDFLEDFNKDKFPRENKIYNLLCSYLNYYFCGISSKNRDKDILKLLEEGHTIVSFDDFDLSYIDDKNHLHININGFFENRYMVKIDSFLRNTILEKK